MTNGGLPLPQPLPKKQDLGNVNEKKGGKKEDEKGEK
jgi:hypothetical protein